MATEQEILEFNFSDKSLFVSTPMYGGMCTGLYHQSMMQLQHLCIQVGLRLASSDRWDESLVTRARNYEVDRFRASGMTHHMFIDADQGFKPGDILQLIMADKDVVCLPYAKKHLNWEQIADALRLGFPPESLDEFACDLNLNTKGPVKFNTIPQRIRDGANGLMMIKKEVYDKLQESFPELEYMPHIIDERVEFGDGKYFYAFFDTSIDPDTKHYLSEDWTFCRRWAKIGGEVYMLPWCRTAHFGNYTYIANPPAIAELQTKVLEENRVVVQSVTGSEK